MSEDERICDVRRIVSHSDQDAWFDVVRAADDGSVTVRFLRACDVRTRGGRLLDLEELLKRELDAGLTVWLEPLEDRNAMRRLRGVELKS